jgi:hypothetical protein
MSRHHDAIGRYGELKMMHRHSSIFCLLLSALVAMGCSEKPAPTVQSANTHGVSSEPATSSLPAAGANITRAKLNASGVAAEYAAHFDSEKLVSIDEERQPQPGSMLSGQYTYQGARLLRYQGAKVSEPAQLDLQFDLQGTLQSGRGPDISNEEIVAIRARAQLLRSHALAQRAARSHSSGH